MDALADSSSLGDLDENDPSSVARFMKKMGRARDDLGDDFESAMDEAMAEGEAPGTRTPNLRAPPTHLLLKSSLRLNESLDP